MAKIFEHKKALELRKHGLSYSQIKNELSISKSTLSLWLRNYPLSKEEIDKLRGKNEIRIEKYRQTMQKKRAQRLQKYYEEEKKRWLPFTIKELFLAGLFLYWGEGGKTQRSQVSINNSDPDVMKFSLIWLRKALQIPKNKIQVFLHLNSDMNIDDEINFWSEELNMPKKCFSNPYIKKSTISSLTQKGFRHGTCGLRVNNTVIKERILMLIKAVADYYSSIISDV